MLSQSYINAPVIYDCESMKKMCYPNPKGIYYCLRIDDEINDLWLNYFNSQVIEEIRYKKNKIKGYPIAITWLELIKQYMSHG